MVIRFLRRLTVLVVVAVAVALGISAIGFTLNRTETFHFFTFSNRIEGTIKEIEGSIKVDLHRQIVTSRIIRIIDKYNPAMSTELKQVLADLIYKMEVKYDNLNVDLICATITHESARTWDPKVISPVGAMGLMQIMPKTGQYLIEYENLKWTSAEEILNNPIYNVRMGCRYLSMLIDFYGIEGALAAYNGGEKRAAMWLANNKADGILWEETQNYVPAVMKLYRKFQN